MMVGDPQVQLGEHIKSRGLVQNLGDMGIRITPWTAHSSMGNDTYSLHYLNSCTGFRQTAWKVSSCGNWLLLM